MSASRHDMPSLGRLADYWEQRLDGGGSLPTEKPYYIGWAEPFCFRCGWLAPIDDSKHKTTRGVWTAASGYLDRAHLVDLVRGGPNDPSNLVPLCTLCHAEHPEFDSYEEAWSWVVAGKDRGWGWTILTNSLGNRLNRQNIKGWWRRYLEVLVEHGVKL